MSRVELKRKIERLATTIDVPLVEQSLRELLREGEDIGGGINSFRLVKHLLRDQSLTDVELIWAYRYLKPPVMAAIERLPNYEFFEGG
ncbi:MAG: hypothetical protein SVX38_07550 [Chloroflexota bacterium]|nr:hypothetical protein [Chloroflexota bacterium]